MAASTITPKRLINRSRRQADSLMSTMSMIELTVLLLIPALATTQLDKESVDCCPRISALVSLLVVANYLVHLRSIVAVLLQWVEISRQALPVTNQSASASTADQSTPVQPSINSNYNSTYFRHLPLQNELPRQPTQSKHRSHKTRLLQLAARQTHVCTTQRSRIRLHPRCLVATPRTPNDTTINSARPLL